MLSLIKQILIKNEIKSVDKQIVHYGLIQRNSRVPIKKLSAYFAIASLNVRKTDLEDQLRTERIKCKK